jgi:hypothetical protein
MSTYSESLIRPKDLLDYSPAIGNNKDTLAVFFHLLAWFRGELRLGATAAISITAGNGGTIFLQPPDDSEEWEILYVMVSDSTKVDVADIVNFSYVDQISSNVIQLEQTTLALGTGSINANITVFPNKDTTNSKVSIVTSISDQGFLSKRQSGNAWLAFRAQYTASATVGTRNVVVTYIFRRRKLS